MNNNKSSSTIELSFCITVIYLIARVVSTSTYINIKNKNKPSIKAIVIDSFVVFISCYIGIIFMNMYVSNVSSIRTPAFTSDPEF